VLATANRSGMGCAARLEPTLAPACAARTLVRCARLGENARMRVLSLSVNGDRLEVAAPDHWSLLEVLRYKLGLTGSKQGCDKGDCGACTVLADGKPILACITLAALCEGREITTIEGLMPAHVRAGGSSADLVQAAFDRCGALQCGFCQPGMMLSARALLDRNACPTRDEIRAALAGNLCRCTGYTQIFEAVELAVAEALGVAPAPRSWEAQHMKPEEARALARESAQALARAREGGADCAQREASASDARRTDATGRAPGDSAAARLHAGTRRDEGASVRGESDTPVRALDPRKGS